MLSSTLAASKQTLSSSPAEGLSDDADDDEDDDEDASRPALKGI